MATILVVDDELGIRALLSEILTDEGHSVEIAENAAQARLMREQCSPDLVLLDIWMPDVDGITLLKEWSTNGQLTMPVIMMSGHGTIDTAVEATKCGAQAFLEKPVTMQKLLRAVEQGLTKPAPRAALAAAPVHLATVTPITAAPSYSNAPNLAAVRIETHIPAEAHHAPTSGYAHHTLSHEQSFELDRPLREARDDFERAYFEFHLAREGGSMTRVAEKTGLERTHLYRKLKQLGVDLTRNKKSAAN
ncbi:MAG: response regulator [Burkholderiales bacterium]|nr:response regulator [Burkholderiales bacterium]